MKRIMLASLIGLALTLAVYSLKRHIDDRAETGLIIRVTSGPARVLPDGLSIEDGCRAIKAEGADHFWMEQTSGERLRLVTSRNCEQLAKGN